MEETSPNVDVGVGGEAGELAEPETILEGEPIPPSENGSM